MLSFSSPPSKTRRRRGTSLVAQHNSPCKMSDSVDDQDTSEAGWHPSGPTGPSRPAKGRLIPPNP